MENTTNLFNAVKEVIEDFDDFNSFQENVGDGLKENEIRKIYGATIRSKVSAYMLMQFSTIRDIGFLILLDEDFNDKNELSNQQICLVLNSDWEFDLDDDFVYEDENLGDMIAKEKHYFVNSIEDLDLEKIKNYFNNGYLSKMRYNNFNVIEKDLKDFISNVKSKL